MLCGAMPPAERKKLGYERKTAAREKPLAARKNSRGGGERKPLLLVAVVEVVVQSQFQNGSAVDVSGKSETLQSGKKLLRATEGNRAEGGHADIMPLSSPGDKTS